MAKKKDWLWEADRKMRKFFRQIWQSSIPLLGKGGGEIPCLHHADIVLLALDGGDHLRIFRGEVFIQKITHEHTHGIALSVNVLGLYPQAYFFQKLRQMVFEDLGIESVAGCPIVDIGQETLGFGHA